MARNYYTLVAGLRQYSLESDNKGFDIDAIREEIDEQVSDKDRDYMRLFYTFYDIENIINLISGRQRFNALGNLTREELMAQMKEPADIPPYIAAVLMAYNDPENPEFDDIDRTKSLEKALFSAYYAECAKSKNGFIREWSEFDRNLRNLMAAYAARKAGLPVADELVGEGYVTDLLSRSSAADFGLRGELDYIDELLNALAEEENLLEKERRIDMIRWRVSDQLTEFDYFNMDAVLAYLAKVNIIYRWMSLDENTGREMFRMLMGSFADTDIISDAEKNITQ